MYRVNENKDANLILLLFSDFQFFLLSLLCNTYGHFSSEFSQELLDLGL